MKRKLLLIIPLVLLLSSCASSLDERVKAREACHKAGGTYEEWDGMFNLQHDCVLGDKR